MKFGNGITKLEPEFLKNFPEFNHHKLVVKIEDTPVNLKGFIAIHKSNLSGVAVGGTRIYPYSNEKEALSDVLQLSKAMTYKCAIAGVPFGGGKGVIIADSLRDKTKALLRTYAEKINLLNGQFYTGEDVGLTEDDVQLMLKESKFFIGQSGLAGDPSTYAALSTFYGMQVAAELILGYSDLKYYSVAIKGVGKVGSELVQLLAKAGSRIVIADINPSAIKLILKKFPDVEVVHPKNIHKQHVDIYCPCALGNEITEKNWHEINAKIICGAANNQLASPHIGDLLYKKGIFFIVDYLVNCGGLIDVVDELEVGGFKKERVILRIKGMKKIIRNVLTESIEKKLPLNRITDQLAENTLNTTLSS